MHTAIYSVGMPGSSNSRGALLIDPSHYDREEMRAITRGFTGLFITLVLNMLMVLITVLIPWAIDGLETHHLVEKLRKEKGRPKLESGAQQQSL